MNNTILQHDVMDRPWPYADGSVQCVVTSPPYFGLRDYGVAGQLGLEKRLLSNIRFDLHEISGGLFKKKQT